MKTNRQLVLTLILMLCCSSIYAQKSEWRLLGTKKVNFNTERDVIAVGVDEGVFKRIKLTVKKSGIHIKDMKVYFANGDVIDVEIKRVIPAGGKTRIIDLPGRNRIIEKVVFWYESIRKNSKRATVRLFGMK